MGPVATALGTGRPFRFVFRTDYGASFGMREIPNTSMPTMLRLQAHLLIGGLVTVTTGDNASRVYSSACLAPESDVSIALQDATALLYEMQFTLINLAGAPMLCEY
jgi:hypothetical protein